MAGMNNTNSVANVDTAKNFVLKSKKTGSYLRIVNHVDVTHVRDRGEADVLNDASEERLFDYFFTLDPRDYTTEYV